MKTEKEKMLAGEPYVSMVPELAAERTVARKLQKKLNIDFYDDPDEQRIILKRATA